MKYKRGTAYRQKRVRAILLYLKKKLYFWRSIDLIRQWKQLSIVRFVRNVVRHLLQICPTGSFAVNNVKGNLITEKDIRLLIDRWCVRIVINPLTLKLNIKYFVVENAKKCIWKKEKKLQLLNNEIA
jgi:hypothetical protein